MIKIVTVTPISKGIGKETLAYFTSRDIKVGALVTVPLRNRNVPALVMGVEEVTYSKTDIKAANFKLKKISANKGYALLPSFVRATELTSQYFASKTGAVIEALVPDTILKNPPTIKITETKNADSKNTQIKQERLLLQADDDERTSIYKSLIREEFAKKQSIFLCTPTINDAERIAHILSRGIKEHTYILHSELGKKEILSRWKRVLNSKHPVLIIATGTFLSIPREDIGTIIIEKEHSPSYKISYRPFIDIRTFAEIYTKEQNKRLIFADFKLRTETLYRKERKEFTDFQIKNASSMATIETKLDNVLTAVEPVPKLIGSVGILDEKIKTNRKLLYFSVSSIVGITAKILYSYIST